MKTRKLYQIREYQDGRFSTPMTSKLREYNRARKLCKVLRQKGHDAFISPWLVWA